MNLYKRGTVTSIGKKYIIFENNFTGAIIYTPRTNDFKKGEKCKVFIYEYRYENLRTIYGFKTIKERILFEDLLSVPGIGPKTAVQILECPIKQLISKIITGNLKDLSELPGLGIKSAKHLIFEMQDKYKNIYKDKVGAAKVIDIKPTLKTLGFNSNQIKYALKHLTEFKKPEIMVEEAIRIISNEKQNIS